MKGSPPEGRLRRRFGQLLSIYHLTDTIGHAAALDQIYDAALDALQHTVGADRASVLLLDEDGRLQFRAWRGLSERYRRAVAGHSPWPIDTADPRPIVVPNVTREPSLGDLLPAIREEGIGAMASIPLASHGRLLGKFMVYFDRPHRFREEQIALMQLIAQHVAFGIERTRAHEAVERHQRELKSVLDNAPDIIARFDRELRHLYVNPVVERASGLPAEAFIGRTNVELGMPAALTEFWHERLRQVFETGRETELEFTFPAPDGPRHYHARLAPERGADGSVLSVLSVVRDVTDRLRAEAALRQKERELTDFVENAVLGLHWVGPDGRIVWANRAELELLGYSRDEYIGHHVAEFHVDRQTVDDILARLARNETLHNCQARLRAKDGSIRHVLISSNVLRDEAGSFIHTRCFTRDISDLRRAEEERAALLASEQAARAEAERANRAKDVFLATLSHELRTPLNSILGWTQLLRSGHLDAATTARALETIERNTRVQAQLVDDLLDISRIVRGSVRLEMRRLNLVAIIDAAVENVRPAARQKRLQLATRLDAAAQDGWGDAARLEQVVSNLLSNAVKFTLEGGAIEVALSRANAAAVICVRDSGEGIAPEFLPHVFDPFRQADASSTRNHSGLGLGLAIVRHLVEAHGGTIHAESAGRGQGATFVVTLPAAPASEVGADRPEDAGERTAVCEPGAASTVQPPILS